MILLKCATKRITIVVGVSVAVALSTSGQGVPTGKRFTRATDIAVTVTVTVVAPIAEEVLTFGQHLRKSGVYASAGAMHDGIGQVPDEDHFITQ